MSLSGWMVRVEQHTSASPSLALTCVPSGVFSLVVLRGKFQEGSQPRRNVAPVPACACRVSGVSGVRGAARTSPPGPHWCSGAWQAEGIYQEKFDGGMYLEEEKKKEKEEEEEEEEVAL
ncbi:hypothetical protein E2C01_092103 [Portunus trituberculatus]|uniref:Uncharacterized protein n=1 Tax=Portunus trituberculatus TaxID=210409 RepID=A0A5B7JWV7_PORTR|nr:hypothetical protein [Portunus trituberculatus]